MGHHIYLKDYKNTSQLFLRALWGRGFALQKSDEPGHECVLRSYLKDNKITLPEKISEHECQENYFRAAAVHLGAHIVYGFKNINHAEVNFLQKAVIGLVEDLRVECMAINEFPGLRQLWVSFHTYDVSSISAWNLMQRFSLSVLDENYQDEHHWVNKARRMFFEMYSEEHSPDAVMKTGLALANDLGQMRIPVNSGQYEQPVSYRDDNRMLWVTEKEMFSSTPGIEETEKNSLSSMLQESYAGQILSFREDLPGNQEQYENGFVVVDSPESVLDYKKENNHSGEYSYTPEWDYRIHHVKENWCKLSHTLVGLSDEALISSTIDKYHNTYRQLVQVAHRIRVKKNQRIRKIEDGDEIDLDPFINAIIDIKRQVAPDYRVFSKQLPVDANNLAVEVLIDLSESTNARISPGVTISELIRDAVILLSETLDVSGENFAVTGFNSNGRQQVNILQFKGFDESYSQVKNRLANISGGFSTRMGAAIRSVMNNLYVQPQKKKLLLVITDGIPSDVDVFDEKYLVEDSWHAVHESQQQEVKTFCLSLDPSSVATIEHIFGKGHYQVLDNLNRLPEMLTSIYMRYLRH